LASALAECFLKKMRKANMVLYEDGGSDFTTTKDLDDLPKEEWPEGADALREAEPKALKTYALSHLSKPAPRSTTRPDWTALHSSLRHRLEKIRDLVLFRYGATGVQDAIKKAVDVKGYIPVYPVRNLNKFTSDRFVLSLLSLSCSRHLMRVSCRGSYAEAEVCSATACWRHRAPPSESLLAWSTTRWNSSSPTPKASPDSEYALLLAVVSYTPSLFFLHCVVSCACGACVSCVPCACRTSS
jgi:hypothetical protein